MCIHMCNWSKKSTGIGNEIHRGSGMHKSIDVATYMASNRGKVNSGSSMENLWVELYLWLVSE